MKIMLIDLNSIGFAAQDGAKLISDGQEVQAVFTFIRTVRRLIKDFPNHKVILLDDGKAKWRFDLFPAYKGNRNIDPKRVEEKRKYQLQKPRIIAAMTALGVDYIMANDHEADDIAAYLANTLSKSPKNEILLISSDRDWIQLVKPNVRWFCTRFEKLCTYDNMKSIVGYDTPREFLEAKVITGDGSDNIPGIGGIGETGAAKLIADYGSVNGFIQKYNKGIEGKLTKPLQMLADNGVPKESSKYGVMLPMRNAYTRNYALMNLVDLVVSPLSDDRHTRISGIIDLESFKQLCWDLNFNSILNGFDDFVRPFLVGKTHAG